MSPWSLTVRRSLGSILLAVGLVAVPGAGLAQADPAPRAAGDGAAALTVEGVLRAYEAACSAIASYDLHIRTTSASVLRKEGGKRPGGATGQADRDWEPVDPRGENTNSRISRQFYDGNRFRNDLIDDNGTPLPEKAHTQVWDGATARQLEYAPREGRIAGYARTQTAFFGICYLDLYRDFDGDYSYADFIRDRLPEGVTVGREGRLVVLAARTGSNSVARGSPFGVRLFLDPEKGLMPARIDLTRADGAVPQSRYVNELAEVQPGVWAPVASRISVFVSDTKSKYYGQELGYLSVEVDRGRSLFNTELDGSTFDLAFPPGVLVSDEIRDTIYRVGAETQEDYLDYLAAQSRLSVEELQRFHPRLRESKVVSATPEKQVLIAVNAAVLVAICSVLGFRMIRNRLASHKAFR